ncbi:DUF4426 domain-containing protein [Luteimonas kalidii]|uniref:DUF4426 domain-containing protein n=1 Tax=Luteimonas kalidii TaxID=3042025 RepID=A0ABT6JXP9_9GAMM|nr:DUF4426 domain-containing protein [Luteimonas kalidii]MDH5834696.1 DUF4426 domain-containing protein [Luteimonas kalidii]
MTERLHRLMRPACGWLLAAAVAGCGVEPSSRADLSAQAEAARQPAELQQADLRIHASLAPTAALNATVAARYGVEPGRDVHLLLVGVRRGAAADEASVPARVQARARDLRGVWQDIDLHEVRSEGFIDYVGTLRVAPPDTLAFEVRVHAEGAPAPAILRFSRDVFAPSGG